jgi:ubiquinone/menaquinone biosynthesis C-methylase UbiE
MGRPGRKVFHPDAPGPAPYVTVEEMRRQPAIVDQLEEGQTDGGPRFTHGTVTELFLKHVPDRNARVLDCGFMHGKFIEFLQQEGYTDVHGLDFVNQTQYGDTSKATLQALDLNTEKFPYPDNHFDAVTAWGLPEHLENPYHFLREVHRVLKPEGIYIATWPNIEHIMNRLIFLKSAEMRNYERHNNHIVIYTRGIFEKTYLRYFSQVEKSFLPGSIVFRPYWLARLISSCFPSTHPLVGHHVMYVLRKKPFVPFV